MEIMQGYILKNFAAIAVKGDKVKSSISIEDADAEKDMKVKKYILDMMSVRGREYLTIENILTGLPVQPKPGDEDWVPRGISMYKLDKKLAEVYSRPARKKQLQAMMLALSKPPSSVSALTKILPKFPSDVHDLLPGMKFIAEGNMYADFKSGILTIGGHGWIWADFPKQLINKHTVLYLTVATEEEAGCMFNLEMKTRQDIPLVGEIREFDNDKMPIFVKNTKGKFRTLVIPVGKALLNGASGNAAGRILFSDVTGFMGGIRFLRISHFGIGENIPVSRLKTTTDSLSADTSAGK